ncbi:Zn(2)-C6 fungal-type domain-containing protein [Trichoderma simmonsii]|uniref:Zn(2)-C6 fungal-type domain-containing protein n=1 Tax=Trichoderma simmonsii TaxID=1491479 RepID=A0A8G0PKB6_9HYPO|nr:Zn(2)-C6 fungal-type domain-containing protein [Trichoderma simmonsii]
MAESQSLNDHDAGSMPSYKRRRVAVACTSCRGRKSRCDGTRPSCSLCVHLGFDCFYEQPSTSNFRGAHPQPRNNDNDRLSKIEEMLHILFQRSHQTADSIERSSPSVQHVEVDTHNQINSKNAMDMNQLIPRNDTDSIDGMATLMGPKTVTSKFFGPSSNIESLRQVSDASAAILKANVQVSESTTDAIEGMIVEGSHAVNIPSGRRPKSLQTANLYGLPKETIALRLIKLFFSDTGMIFPITDEETILQAYYSVINVDDRLINPSCFCLINSIFAIATYISAKPDRSPIENAQDSEAYCEKARAIWACTESNTAQLETVQYLLLMAHYYQGTNRPDEAWSLHGQAVQTAYQLGLHSRSLCYGFSASEAERRRRTWLGCVVLDRLFSMTLGRPFIIPSSYINIDPPDTNTIHGPSALRKSRNGSYSCHTVCLFTATIQLYEILQTIISDLYGSNLDQSFSLDLSAAFTYIMPKEQRLNQWREKLYRQLQRRPWGNNNSMENDSEAIFDKLSTIMTLRYLNIRILLHRPVLSTVLLHRHTSYSDRNLEKDPPFSRHVAELSIESCQQSAIDIIDIIYETRDSYLALKTWWFTIYYTFNAAVVIFSCILLEITSPATRSSSEQASTTTDTSRSNKIVNLFEYLQRAAESLQRVGEDTKQGSRVNKMLQKHLEISSRLTRENADRYSVPLSVISLGQETQDGNSQPNIYNWDSQLDNNELLAVTSCPPNPLEMFELETSREWINSDLYTDLFQAGEGSAT